jgi:hypothetical protein
LFRCLNELKKNGVLGRESVLRKTMLDECKGDNKFMELLVVFSTAVLKRIDAATTGTTRRRDVRSVAGKLAMASTLSTSQQGSLIPLSIAHAASLGNMLKQRQEKQERYSQFNGLLDSKRAQLHQRVKATVRHKRRESNVNEDSQIKKIVQENWVPGAHSARWAQTLLTGDDVNAGDMPLQRPFEEVWEAVQEGRALGAEVGGVGLLAGLERRVQVQRERLMMWQEFHEGLKDPDDQHFQRGQEDVSGAKFEFTRHQGLQFGETGKERTRVSEAKANAYGDILVTLRTDIVNASRSRRHGGAGWTSKHEGGSEYRSHDLFSPVKGSAPANAVQNVAKPIKPLSILEDRPSLLAPAKKPELNGFKIKRLGRNDSKTDTSLPPKKEASPPPIPEPAEVEERPLTPEMETPIKIIEASPLRHEETPTAADLIVSSVVNATPSPIKGKQMSLTERTRMSMAFFKAPDSVDSGIAMPPSTASADSDSDDTLPALPTTIRDNDGEGNVQRRVSLLERTRLSMASLPNPQSRKSLAPRSKKRESLFPVNQFETPGKPRAGPEMKRDTTPTDRLFSEEAEYASVFRSRPRVAHSPIPSPSEGEGDVLSDGMRDDAFGSEDEDDGEDTVLGSSPLVGRSRVLAG